MFSSFLFVILIFTKFIYSCRFLKPTKPAQTSPSPGVLPTPNDEYLAPNVSAAQGSVTRGYNSTNGGKSGVSDQVLDYTTALTLTVAIGLSLLVLNIILFAALLYRKDRNSVIQKMKYDSVSAQPLCTVDSGIRPATSTHENISTSGKDGSGSCSSTNIQCTELHTFPTPPDIGDRNTEVTFHSSNSLHSLLNQPTSQFIPPPPLLATTPPTPPTGSIPSENIEVETCTSAGCFTDVNTGYPEIVNGVTFTDTIGHGYVQSSTYQGVLYNNGQQCKESGICPVSTESCSYPPASHCQPLYCTGQYSSNISQYSSTTEQYSSSPSQYSGSHCQYPGTGTNSCSGNTVSGNVKHFSGTSSAKQTAPQYTAEQFYRDTYSPDTTNSSRTNIARSATLSRQTSTSSNSSVTRNPQPPPRTSTLPAYATLPRHETKDKENM